MTDEWIVRAVGRIVEDLSGRKGLRQEWEQIDEEIQAEIEESWRAIIGEEVPK